MVDADRLRLDTDYGHPIMGIWGEVKGRLCCNSLEAIRSGYQNSEARIVVSILFSMIPI